jgi:hypothetical protein
VEQQSGPPSTDRTGDETRSTGRFTRDEETRSPGRFSRDPDTGPEPGAERDDEESRGAVTPPEVLPTPDQPPAGDREVSTEAAPIMSNLPHSRPQQRSQKRAAPKRATGRQASAAKPGRTGASSRRQAAGTASRSRSRATASSRRSSAPAGAAPDRSDGIPARAIGTAVQIAAAPWKLTFAATRRAANAIGRRLGL